MTVFTGAGRLPLIVGVVAIVALVAGGLIVPFEARNSVPYGIDLTIDFNRRPPISVNGHTIVPNYDGFNRLDLDLRAYQHKANYDLLVHIRPDRPGATDIRIIPLDVKGEQIPDTKDTFANPFITVRFPPINDSAGRHFYVWVERGIRNRDNVVALWSMKSYSRVTGRDVIGAFLDQPPTKRAPDLFRGGMIALLVGLVLAFGWLMAAVTAFAVVNVRGKPATGVAPRRRRWYTVSRPGHEATNHAARAGAGNRSRQQETTGGETETDVSR